ncbi:hypothetical protein F5888DRAFT_1888551, partial [Russula emetica]
METKKKAGLSRSLSTKRVVLSYPIVCIIPDLSTMFWVTSSDLTIRVSRGLRGSPAFKAFARRTDAVKEGRWKIGDSNVMVLDFATVLESIFGVLRMTRSGCSTRGGGRVGNDGFLILSPVTLEEGDAGGLTGTAHLMVGTSLGVLGVAVDAQDGVVTPVNVGLVRLGVINIVGPSGSSPVQHESLHTPRNAEEYPIRAIGIWLL